MNAQELKRDLEDYFFSLQKYGRVDVWGTDFESSSLRINGERFSIVIDPEEGAPTIAKFWNKDLDSLGAVKNVEELKDLLKKYKIKVK